MPPRKKDPDTNTEVSSDALELAENHLKTAADALAQAKAPRLAKQLNDAGATFTAAGEHAKAVQARTLLAELELARGNTPKALTHSRAAVRAARRSENLKGQSLALEVVVRCHYFDNDLNEAAKAAQELLQALRLAEPGRGGARGLRVLSRVRAAQGEYLEALRCADAADALDGEGIEGQELRYALYVCAGCPAAALDGLADFLKANPESETLHSFLILRSWANQSLGQSERAVRDARRAAKESAASGDGRAEAVATATLGYLASTDSDASEGQARRAATSVAKANRLVRRVRDPKVSAYVASLNAWSENGAPPDSLSVKAAATQLSQMAAKTESLHFVDACVKEMGRLMKLTASQPPYGHLEAARKALALSVFVP